MGRSEITALGYIGVRSDRIDDWTDFASGLLGMQKIDRAGSQIAFRMDDHRQRLVVTNEGGEPLAFLGWEVRDEDALDALGARLSDAGYPVELGTGSLTASRFVEKLIICNDPAGNRIELYCGPMLTQDAFVPGRPISGFKTGPLGMGHAVLHVRDLAAMLPFYRDVLGFQVSDQGQVPIPLCFLHVNQRHHSFAMIQTGRAGFHHFMVEYTNLDDVGQGFDLAGLQEGRIAYTLGRHTNDWMTSYYAHTPSGFFVESGWGGRMIEPESWEEEVMLDGPSFWGHDRPYLPDDLREAFRDLRLGAAAKGLQAPPPPDCPWLQGVLSGRGEI